MQILKNKNREFGASPKFPIRIAINTCFPVLPRCQYNRSLVVITIYPSIGDDARRRIY